MSVMWADDFKGYGSDVSLMLDGLYAGLSGGAALVENPDPNEDGLVFRSGQPNTGTVLRRVFPASVTTAGVGFRWWLASLPATDTYGPQAVFANGANNEIFTVQVTTTGALRVRQGNYGGTILGQTPGPAITANAFNHIEIKSVANAVTGSVEVRVNGVPVLTVMGVNTGTEFSQFRFDQRFVALTDFYTYVKDLVAWNNLGANNNNFLGTVSVIGRTPDADVDFTWTPSTGTTGYNLLNNSPPLDDTEYISAAFPAPDPSVFDMSPLPDDITVVKALITQLRVRKSDGGAGNVQAGLISDGVTGLGADRPVTTAFTYYEDVFDRNPDGDVNWTPASAEDAMLQVNRTE